MQIQIREQIQRPGCDGKPGNAVPRCFQRVTRRRLGGSACFAGWRLCHTNTRLCWATNTKVIVCVTNATRCWAKYYKMICLSHKHNHGWEGMTWLLGVEELDSSATDCLSCYKQVPDEFEQQAQLPTISWHWTCTNSEGRITQMLLAPPQSWLIFAESKCILSVGSVGNYTVHHFLHIIVQVQLLCRSLCMQIKVFLNGFRCSAIDGSVPVLNIFGKNDNILLRVFDNDST